MEAVSANRSRRVDASRRRADLSGRLSRRRASQAEAAAAAEAETDEELPTTGVDTAAEVEGELTTPELEAAGDETHENEVDDVTDESPAEVVDMDDEDETVAADADAEEKGE
jgi:hypothetical protein